jgi:hypothetical protein
MEPETKAKVMFGVLGLICGGIIAMIIGFNWGGWTTSKDPNYKENLKEFEKLDSYGMKNTSDYVKKFGWDKMPGEEKAGPDVAAACAIGIEALIKK